MDFLTLKKKGAEYMKEFEFEKAEKVFFKALEKKQDAEVHFLISVCLMFLDDPTYVKHMKKAYQLNPKATKEMVRLTYESFFAVPTIAPPKWKELEEWLKK